MGEKTGLKDADAWLHLGWEGAGSANRQNPELQRKNIGYAMESLLEAGARDAFFTPVYMKKNRPAYKLSVLCDEEHIREMDDILFRETTTIGVRRCRVERDILERRLAEVKTPLGTAKVKVCTLPDGGEVFYPEYESVRELARKSGKSYREVYRAVKEKA